MANSKIYLGSTNIESLFQGADDISIYLGENKVYPLEEPFKWKATYSDSSVTSAECGSSSEIVRDEINKTNLVSVEIGNCVKSIGNQAFSSYRSLASITIPDSVTSIGYNAFTNCSGLTSCTIGSGVTSIGNEAFASCRNLTSIDIPSGVTNINKNAFNSCRSLTSITVNAVNPPTLGSNVFYDTNNCPIYVPCESINTYKAASGWSDYASRIQAIPNSCPKFYATYSGGETYEADCDGNTTLTTGNTKPSGYEYSAMTEAIIGDCVETIGIHTFSGCTSLSAITISSGVTSIGQQSFSSCYSISSIDIPSGVTSIGESAFSGCTSLTSITIPDSVTNIGGNCFRNCSGLTSCTIGSGLTTIGASIFYNCTGLTSVTFNAVIPPVMDGGNVFFNTNNCPILVPSQSVSAYKSASGWSYYASRIQAIP